jgi:hypothetical protein
LPQQFVDDRKRGEAGRRGSSRNNSSTIASAAKPGAAGRRVTIQRDARIEYREQRRAQLIVFLCIAERF